jgi:hypothetical protein
MEMTLTLKEAPRVVLVMPFSSHSDHIGVYRTDRCRLWQYLPVHGCSAETSSKLFQMRPPSQRLRLLSSDLEHVFIINERHSWDNICQLSLQVISRHNLT